MRTVALVSTGDIFGTGQFRRRTQKVGDIMLRCSIAVIVRSIVVHH